MKYDVFISYSRKDYVDAEGKVIPGNVVSLVKKTLKRNNISFWFDEDGIYSGQNFVEKIVTNIECSAIVLFLSSANSNDSKWTSKEIACADEAGKHIIPLRIDDSPYNKQIRFRIADLDYIDYSVNPKKALQELVRSINAYLEEHQTQLQGQSQQEQQEPADRPIIVSASNSKVSLFNAIKTGFRKYFDFSSETSSAEFWQWVLFVVLLPILITAVFLFVGIVILNDEVDEDSTIIVMYVILLYLSIAICIIPTISAFIRYIRTLIRNR